MLLGQHFSDHDIRGHCTASAMSEVEAAWISCLSMFRCKPGIAARGDATGLWEATRARYGRLEAGQSKRDWGRSGIGGSSTGGAQSETVLLCSCADRDLILGRNVVDKRRQELISPTEDERLTKALNVLS